MRSRPADACRPLISPTNEDEIDFWVKPRIMLAQQGPCLFSDQVHLTVLKSKSEKFDERIFMRYETIARSFQLNTFANLEY